jgi:hypothetical protein
VYCELASAHQVPFGPSTETASHRSYLPSKQHKRPPKSRLPPAIIFPSYLAHPLPRLPPNLLPLLDLIDMATNVYHTYPTPSTQSKQVRTAAPKMRDSSKRRGMLVDPAKLEALSAVCDAGLTPSLSLLHVRECPGNDRCEVVACAAAAAEAERRRFLLLDKPCKVTQAEMREAFWAARRETERVEEERVRWEKSAMGKLMLKMGLSK